MSVKLKKQGPLVSVTKMPYLEILKFLFLQLPGLCDNEVDGVDNHSQLSDEHCDTISIPPSINLQ